MKPAGSRTGVRTLWCSDVSRWGNGTVSSVAGVRRRYRIRRYGLQLLVVAKDTSVRSLFSLEARMKGANVCTARDGFDTLQELKKYNAYVET